MRILRRRFNMVEIALALAVLSLGISAILTMMPVGVSSGKQAIAENNTADAAGYVLGIYNTFVMNSIQNAAAGGLADPIGAWKTALRPPNGNDSADPRTLAKLADRIDWSNITDDTAQGGVHRLKLPTTPPTPTNLLWYKESAADTYPRALLYRQTTLDADGNESVDFAAVVRVWSGQGVTIKTRKWEGADPTVGGDEFGSDLEAGLRLFVELSWPVGVDWEDREKRVYVLDVCNPLEASERIYE